MTNARDTHIIVHEAYFICLETFMASTTNTNTSLPTNILSQSEPTIDLKVDILDTSSPNDERLKHEDQQNDQKLMQEHLLPPNTDQTIIENIQRNAVSVGGLASEAQVTTIPTEPHTTETKNPVTTTFDLDSMLGVTNVSVKNNTSEIPPVQTVTPVSTTPTAILTTPIPQPEPQAAVIPLTNEVHKTSGIKIMVFAVLFAALGFTTFFILKTMYPLEFAQVFNGTDTANIHASADIISTGDTTLTGENITGTDVLTTGEEIFGELNELKTVAPEEMIPEETDISKLTTYASEGNMFVLKGKELNNTTIIKYGLYISKKSTAFLEKIANGEEINNLSGYFAQFEQYRQKLEELIAQPQTSLTPSS